MRSPSNGPRQKFSPIHALFVSRKFEAKIEMKMEKTSFGLVVGVVVSGEFFGGKNKGPLRGILC